MHFVIIGGDAAGMSAASRSKRNQPELEVTVLEKTMDVSYSACGMPYNIADPARPIDDLVVREAQVFRDKQGIDLRTGHTVDTLDTKARTVSGKTAEGEDFKVPYDKLLIATGATPIIPGLPGFDLPGVMGLKSLEDGRRIKHFIGERNVKRIAIIGMGYIALEMCEALRARELKVDMVKPRPVFLPWLNEKLAHMVREEVRAKGVGVHPGHEIKEIRKENGLLKVLCDDLELDCELVLVAIGVKPVSNIADRAGLQLGPGKAISVDRTLCTSDENIYAAGDCADAVHIVTGEKVWIPLALRANRAGWAVADNVTGRHVELEGVAGTAVFKVFDLQVAATGLSVLQAERAGFEPVEVMIKSRTRAHAHPGSTMMGVTMVGDKKSGRLLGVQMVGHEGVAHRVNAPAVALQARMTVDAFAQSDLAYAPPFGPVWDPMLTAANQLLKKMV
ncbi:MAG: FAD-dependent oxidoreductase [Deltaproteobacteria bacterium]|nr:FAD-dependent oxidoreductase [Deltaproteobacteria bacterium]